MRVNVWSDSYTYMNGGNRIKMSINIAYFNILFKDDVVTVGEKIEIVESVSCKADTKCYFDKMDDERYNNPKIYFPEIRVKFYQYEGRLNRDIIDYGIGQPLIPCMVLHKRPLKNWIKYFVLLVTKNYIK